MTKKNAEKSPPELKSHMTVRMDPDLKKDILDYAEDRRFTLTRALEALVRQGLAKYQAPSTTAGALSLPLMKERVHQLPDLDPLVAEEIARIEVETLAKVLGGEIAEMGRTFQRRVESLGKTLNDFDSIAEAKLFLLYNDQLTDAAKRQKVIQDDENIVEIMTALERLEKEKKKKRQKTLKGKAKTA